MNYGAADRLVVPEPAEQESPDELVAATLRDLEKLRDPSAEIVTSTPVLRKLLRCAAYLLTEAARSGQPVKGDAGSIIAVTYRARDELGMTGGDFARIPPKSRIALETAVYFAAERCRALFQMAPPNAKAAELARIDAATASVLRQYRHNVGTLGTAAADSWAAADIAREACRIAPNTDVGRHPDWQRLHDAIRQRFNRFVVHIDDSQLIPYGECEVWFKGDDYWQTARYEPGGSLNLDSVAAIRPLSA